MKLSEIYNLAIEMGRTADPRGWAATAKELEENQKTLDKLEKKEQVFFDRETLNNPYADTRILHGDGNTEVNKVMVGIDLESGEIMLADRLNQKGAEIDLLISHHPEGQALAALADVMTMQAGCMTEAGVLPNVAEGMLSGRVRDVRYSLGVSNHFRSVNTAQLLNIPFMCVHTPCDNLVTDFLVKLFNQTQPVTVGEAVDLLKEVPEYQQAALHRVPPLIVAGDEKRSFGKFYVDFTGGTTGPDDAYEKLALAGVSTVISMYADQKTIEWANKNHLNIIVAGHMASDSLGVNLFLDGLEKNGVAIIPASGVIRVKRS